MPQCLVLSTSGTGQGEPGLSCLLPVLAGSLVTLATIHSQLSSLPPPPQPQPLLEAQELRPALVATVTGTPLSVWLAGSSAHPQGDEGRSPVAMATP